MKVYWSKCGPRHGNFGDKLTPLLLRHFGITCEWAPPQHAALIGIGSILEKVPATFRGTIWTTGFMHAESKNEFPHARIAGLRGRLTAERVLAKASPDVPLGDAGLLCDLLHGPERRTAKLGLIPHFVDADDPVLAAFAHAVRDAVIIDICGETHDVFRQVARCENILSSSLHGLALADSLGIPNHWMELNRGPEVVTGSGFKYRDYYSVFGLSPKPFSLSGETTLDTVLALLGDYKRPGLDGIKSQLRERAVALVDAIPSTSVSEHAAQVEAREKWRQQFKETKQWLEKSISHSARFILLDDDLIRPGLEGLRAVPFLERGGHYWGPPADDAAALLELRRLAAGPLEYLVVAYPCFWMLSHYPKFFTHVSACAEQLWADDNLVVFRFTAQGRQQTR